MKKRVPKLMDRFPAVKPKVKPITVDFPSLLRSEASPYNLRDMQIAINQAASSIPVDNLRTVRCRINTSAGPVNLDFEPCQATIDYIIRLASDLLRVSGSEQTLATIARLSDAIKHIDEVNRTIELNRSQLLPAALIQPRSGTEVMALNTRGRSLARQVEMMAEFGRMNFDTGSMLVGEPEVRAASRYFNTSVSESRSDILRSAYEECHPTIMQRIFGYIRSWL